MLLESSISYNHQKNITLFEMFYKVLEFNNVINIVDVVIMLNIFVQ